MALIASGITARAGYNRRIPGYDYSPNKPEKVVIKTPKPIKAKVEPITEKLEPIAPKQPERVKRPLLALPYHKQD